MIDENQLGQLAGASIVNGEYVPDWHPYEDYSTTHAALRELGGGASEFKLTNLIMLPGCSGCRAAFLL